MTNPATHSTAPLRVAVIGLGWWGKTIAHYLKSARNMALNAVTDLNTDTGAAFAQSIGAPFFQSLQDVLASPNVDAVILCTPHTLHAAQIVQVAQADKHVFCEKPLTLNRADALAAIEAVQSRGLALGVGHERRFEPPVMAAMQLIQSGALGTPLQMEANFSQDKFLQLASDNWRLSAAEAPAGPMTATGIHLLDLSIGVFGPAQSVYASVKQLGSPLINGDTLAILATYQRGGHALISAILATPFVGRFAVYGSKGWVEVRDKTHPEQSTGWTMTTCIRGEEPVIQEFPPHPAVLSNLEAFADAALGIAPYPVPHEQMVANISALEAVIRSTQSGAVEQVVSGS
jgi:predicted dehydrogenase